MGHTNKEIEYLEKRWNRAIIDYEVNECGQVIGLCLYPNDYDDWSHIDADFSAIGKLTSLRKLEIGFNVSSLDPLINLKELEWLQIEDGKIEDVSPLKDLVNLKYLELPCGDITDISSLSGLKSLNHLILYANKIEDISVIGNFHNLVHLNLTHNKITDIAALSSVSQLQTLSLGSNQITEVSSISNLLELENLALDNNKISSIDGLAVLGKLRHLDIQSNYLSNISILEKLENLESLSCEKNQISKIGAVAKLSKLRTINLASNQISDIEPLHNLEKVNWLNLAENPLEDISGLENLNELSSINLSGIHVKNFDVLVKFPKLHLLRIDGNGLNDADIAFITACPNLKYISLNHNEIEEVTIFNQLKLEHLSLLGNHITTIFPLIRLQTLFSLNLEHNPLQLGRYARYSSETEKDFFSLWFELANVYLKRNQVEHAFACLLLLQSEEFRYKGNDAMRLKMNAYFETQAKDDEPVRLINQVNQRALKLFNLGKDHAKSSSDLSLIILEILNYLDHPFKDVLFRVLVFYARSSFVNDYRLLKILNCGILVRSNDQIDELIAQYEYKPTFKNYQPPGGRNLSYLNDTSGCTALALILISLLLLFGYGVYLFIYGIVNHLF
jgi:Leucine-rich repeat (LRR) protein